MNIIFLIQSTSNGSFRITGRFRAFNNVSINLQNKMFHCWSQGELCNDSSLSSRWRHRDSLSVRFHLSVIDVFLFILWVSLWSCVVWSAEFPRSRLPFGDHLPRSVDRQRGYHHSYHSGWYVSIRFTHFLNTVLVTSCINYILFSDRVLQSRSSFMHTERSGRFRGIFIICLRLNILEKWAHSEPVHAEWKSVDMITEK